MRELNSVVLNSPGGAPPPPDEGVSEGGRKRSTRVAVRGSRAGRPSSSSKLRSSLAALARQRQSTVQWRGDTEERATAEGERPS